jgi:cytochrome bd-type quinol oxidase subunit 2
MSRLPRKAVVLVHRIAFATALAIFLVNCWVQARRHPEIMRAIVNDPLSIANLLLILALVLVALLLWPWTRRAAEFVVGDREIK